MSLVSWINDKWVGPSVTHITRDRASHRANLYLTFDDGPDPFVTEKILRLLEKHKSSASFFVIVKEALSHPSLVLEMKSASHAVGNHSWDHRWWNYFQGRKGLKEWIIKSEERLNTLLSEKNIGFRPPAGVCTPPLRRVLKELRLPLILWSLRFFDTRIPWTKKRALAVIDKLNPGDIILLHDSGNRSSAAGFLDTLSAFIEKAQEKGFYFKPLPKELYRGEEG